MMSEKEQLQKYIEEINEEVKTLQNMKRVKCIKLAMLEAHERYSKDSDDYHAFIHQRIDDLMGEIKWQS
jgi:hypothetical protein